MVITLKQVGAVLMSILMLILKLFLRQFNCASVGKQTHFDTVQFLFYITQFTNMSVGRIIIKPDLQHVGYPWAIIQGEHKVFP